MPIETREVVITCNGEELFSSDIQDWLKVNEDEREYLEEICEFITKGEAKEVTFCEMSGNWHVKVR